MKIKINTFFLNFLLITSLALICLDMSIGVFFDLKKIKFKKLEIFSSNVVSISAISSYFILKNSKKYLAIPLFLTCGSTVVIKKIIKRTRPDKTNNHSFPSGHSAIMTCLALILSIKKKWYFLWLPAFFVYAQRIACLRHHFSDVFGAVLLTSIIVYISFKLFKYEK